MTNDLLERLGEDAPSERLRERLAQATQRERRRRTVFRAAAILVAAAALAGALRLGMPQRNAPALAEQMASEDVFERLDAVARLLAGGTLASGHELGAAEIAQLVTAVRSDPSVNVRLLSIDVLSGADGGRATLEQLDVEDAPDIVRARLQAALSPTPSGSGP
ncbi:MAG: hypothetical protein AAGA81_07655 [Acidobacteriota bacterium]